MSEEVNVAAEVETGETEAAEKVEKGVQGRTQRDMQNVTEVVEERAVLDIRKIDNAIDKLVKIREMDTKRTAVKFTPKNNLSLEDVNYFVIILYLTRVLCMCRWKRRVRTREKVKGSLMRLVVI